MRVCCSARASGNGVSGCGVWRVGVCTCACVCSRVHTSENLRACVCAGAGAHALARSLARSLVACVCVCVCVTVLGHDVNPVQEYEMPYPLQKDAGEEEDAWVLKDGKGVVVLKLRFEI